MNSTQESLYTPQWARRVAAGGTAWFSGGVSAPYSMAYGNPDPALFPADDVAAAAARILADPRRAALALQYGNIQGLPELIEMLAAKLHREEGISVTRENIIITNGASSAIGLAARSLIDEGDAILVEAPSFPGALGVLQRTGAELINMPMGPQGIDVEATEALLNALHLRGIRPKILYTIPTFQNPSGLTIPAAARSALLDIARRYDLMVIEDDAYRELYYDSAQGSLPPTLYSLDVEGRVIRTGTFSKILAPGMRLGWAVAQPDIIRRMLLLKEEGGTSPFAQHVAAEYAGDGALTTHIAALVAAYAAKRDAMLTASDRYFPPGVEWTRPSGGFFVWVTLPPTVAPDRLAQLAREQGVEYLPGEPCFAQPPAVPGTYVRLSYSLLGLADIDEAIKRLGQVITTLL
ncbi:MAG: PLP-dependent aminotransferase family protein [Chloroflexota bacterium]